MIFLITTYFILTQSSFSFFPNWYKDCRGIIMVIDSEGIIKCI